jgi:hypothetical protein
MSKKKSIALLMAVMAMSYFNPSLSFSQTSTPRPVLKIKTPNSSSELLNEDDSSFENKQIEEEKSTPSVKGNTKTGSIRALQQHGLGLGIGQTFLMGNYSKHGNDKITLDIFYSYAASYSFDLLINAHMSEHKDESERLKILGLSSSIKARVVEFDNLSPYFLGGLGFYAPRAKRRVGDENKWSDQKLIFGLNFGGGIDLRLNDQYVVGILAHIHAPFAVEQDKGSDVKGYYSKLLITGMYLF